MYIKVISAFLETTMICKLKPEVTKRLIVLHSSWVEALFSKPNHRLFGKSLFCFLEFSLSF